MQFTYDLFLGKLNPKRMATETSFNKACDEFRRYHPDSEPFIECYNNLKDHEPAVVLKTQEDIKSWSEALERNQQWASKEDRANWKPMENLLEDSPPAGNKPLIKEPTAVLMTLQDTIDAQIDKEAKAIQDLWYNRDTLQDTIDAQIDKEAKAIYEEVIKPKDAINPTHYASYFGDNEVIKNMQWLEAIQYLKQYRNPDIFKAAVELQARKYIDRLGGKDNEVQEIKKSIWYLKFLAAYIANGNKPIRVADIQKLLGE